MHVNDSWQIMCTPISMFRCTSCGPALLFLSQAVHILCSVPAVHYDLFVFHEMRTVSLVFHYFVLCSRCSDLF